MNNEDGFKNLSICCMVACCIQYLDMYSQTNQIIFAVGFLFLIISAIVKILKG